MVERAAQRAKRLDGRWSGGYFATGDLGEAAVALVDDYLTQGNEDSLFSEPEFLKSQDLNAFLKSEKLGKGEEFSPKLRTQMMLAKRMLRKSPRYQEIRAVAGEALNNEP